MMITQNYTLITCNLHTGISNTLTIKNCYSERHAMDKFSNLYRNEDIIIEDCYAQELTTRDELILMEREALTEHLFGTTDIGLTDDFIYDKYCYDED